MNGPDLLSIGRQKLTDAIYQYQPPVNTPLAKRYHACSPHRLDREQKCPTKHFTHPHVGHFPAQVFDLSRGEMGDGAQGRNRTTDTAIFNHRISANILPTTCPNCSRFWARAPTVVDRRLALGQRLAND